MSAGAGAAVPPPDDAASHCLSLFIFDFLFFFSFLPVLRATCMHGREKTLPRARAGTSSFRLKQAYGKMKLYY